MCIYETVRWKLLPFPLYISCANSILRFLPCSFLRRLILLLSSLLLQKDLVSSNFKRAKRGPKEHVNLKHKIFHLNANAIKGTRYSGL